MGINGVVEAEKGRESREAEAGHDHMERVRGREPKRGEEVQRK